MTNKYMTSDQIRQQFFDFFQEKEHRIVASSPIVVKDDPTLMFTNAGMNQFKDYFLGTKSPEFSRIADTQKCLRVSGKHNDLEEVGRDSYHHTMFEMLGNWSFGDYFKKEAIAWAWELLTLRYGLNPERLYASVFKGDPSENLKPDEEAASIWKQYINADRVLYFDKKDNFWEMGDSGPCGPCSEIHIDLRPDSEREKIPGHALVNQDDPMVVEIWNLVFIQYNRKADGSLHPLPSKHVDTGMGFERLCMALQNKTSSYDTDIFLPFIQYLEKYTGISYTGSYKHDAHSDIAMRVIVDHLRAVSFTIADGELPSNTGAGYVIRRILRRAVRYGYSFLGRKEPFIHTMVPLLSDRFSHVFPELNAQLDFIQKVIMEEEKSFLRTLEGGLKRLDQIQIEDGVISGTIAFELYDTFGFPIDLTRLIAEEKNWKVDEVGFTESLNEQKERSRADAKRQAGDWVVIKKEGSPHFVGYDHLKVDETRILRYRLLEEKGKTVYQIILEMTPFYPEGGGQVGDTGFLISGEEKIRVVDTVKENDLIIQVVNSLPSDPSLPLIAMVDAEKRHLTEKNHTATHLLHSALREVLGDHVQQRGSLVKEDYLRFDFSHFQKMTEEEIRKVESIVNAKIIENIQRKEDRRISISDAKAAGAMMLFGEKYGEEVRMITFDPHFSVELCGGCHVSSTGQIGSCKITSEGAIAAGIRRIEAITGVKAFERFQNLDAEMTEIRDLVKTPNPSPVPAIAQLIQENKHLKKEIEQLKLLKAKLLKDELKETVKRINGMNLITAKLTDTDANTAKTLAFNLGQELENAIILLGIDHAEKPMLILYIAKELTNQYHAAKIIKDLAAHIQGGGGGQPFFATAGGSNPRGLDAALQELERILS